MSQNERGIIKKYAITIMEHAFTSTRKVLLISFALTVTMIMVFGFWTWMGVIAACLVVFVGIVWCDFKVHPVPK